MKPIGLLWDSISNNTGDIAIGMVMRRFCETHEIPYEVVDPFSFSPAHYSIFIIGGGQLLRGKDDVFYKNFRVPGPHILNAVGIHHPDHLDYLQEYQLVSVRSQAEKNQLQKECPDLRIEVCPCPTIQFAKYYKSEIESLGGGMDDDEKDTIGIHLNNTTLRKLPNLFSSLEVLNKKYKIIFIPFTHYENDRYLMETLAKWLPGAKVSHTSDPVSTFFEIGKVRALISSSLHASMFAYVQNVPVLAFPNDFKIQYFFMERNFSGSLYTKEEEILRKLDCLLENPPNYCESVKHDNLIIDRHSDEIRRIVKSLITYEYNDTYEFNDEHYGSLHRAYYLFKLQTLTDVNSYATKMLDGGIQLRNLEQENRKWQILYTKEIRRTGNLRYIKNDVVSRRLLIQKLYIKSLKRHKGIETLMSDLVATEKKNILLADRLNGLEKELVSLAMSKSWRVTRPLRKIAKILKGKKNV